jgi:hypothetical protein
MKLTFYTVRCDKTGYPVKFCAPPIYRVKTFRGPFGDPGEASQEFKACIGGEGSCYLELAHFQAKVRALAQQRGTEMGKFAQYKFPARRTVILYDGVEGKVKRRYMSHGLPHYMIETSTSNRFWIGEWEIKEVKSKSRGAN